VSYNLYYSGLITKPEPIGYVYVCRERERERERDSKRDRDGV
jgi:hypothetical protein